MVSWRLSYYCSYIVLIVILAVFHTRSPAPATPPPPPYSRWTARVALRALLRTAREVCQGMTHLHELNVIHGECVPVFKGFKV